MQKEYIDRIELRTRLGLSHTSIVKAEKQGRIKAELVNGKWLFDWIKNQKSYTDSSVDPYRQTPENIAKRNERRGIVRHRICKHDTTDMTHEDGKGNHPIDLIPDPVDKDGDFPSNMSRAQADSIKQVYLAKRAKVAFLKEVGVLVEQSVMKEEWEDLATKTQKSILAIPDRVSEMFAATTDSNWIHKELTKELTYALMNIANYEIKMEGTDVDIQAISEE